jgi:hypothetical protein
MIDRGILDAKCEQAGSNQTMSRTASRERQYTPNVTRPNNSVILSITSEPNNATLLDQLRIQVRAVSWDTGVCRTQLFSSFVLILVHCSVFTALSSCLGHYLPLPRTAFLCILILATTQLRISSDLPSVACLLRFPYPGSSFLNGYSSPATGAAHSMPPVILQVRTRILLTSSP